MGYISQFIRQRGYIDLLGLEKGTKEKKKKKKKERKEHRYFLQIRNPMLLSRSIITHDTVFNFSFFFAIETFPFRLFCQRER